MVSLLEIFAGIAIIIACLGLFGLASFTAEQRTKEIGIRKVLGASEVNLTLLICKEFVMLVFISNIIAWPLAYYSSVSWLNDFAYRIDFEIFPFVFSGSLTLVLSILTILYQTIKAAFANPVDALRYE